MIRVTGHVLFVVGIVTLMGSLLTLEGWLLLSGSLPPIPGPLSYTLFVGLVMLAAGAGLKFVTGDI